MRSNLWSDTFWTSHDCDQSFVVWFFGRKSDNSFFSRIRIKGNGNCRLMFLSSNSFLSARVAVLFLFGGTDESEILGK